MRFWEALLAEDVNQVRDFLQSDASLAQACAPYKLCRREPDLTDQMTPLHAAAGRGWAQQVKLLLVAGADVDAEADGATPLHEAAEGGHQEVVELLLFRQANVYATDSSGRTALHRAAMAGHDDVANLLLDNGARLEATDDEGNTVLHCLAAGGCETAVKRVLESDVETDPCNTTHQRTPLHLVVVHADHTTASRLHPAQRHQRARMERSARLLIEHGADVNAVDAGGNTPLDLFNYLEGDNENDPLVRLLRKHGGRWMRYQHRHAHANVNANANGASSNGSRMSFDEQPQVDQAVLAHDSHNSRMGTTSGSMAARSAMGFVGDPIPLDTGSVIIGRNPDCDVRYRSRTLSRKHAQITFEQGSYMIKDLGSHNGVIINGRKVHAPHLLSPGETITLGTYEFEFDGENLLPLREELSENELRAELKR
ncbi:ankyrin repeat domain-containing protein [Phycisphaerales bacterium AB-hyl4]|uniref:Ankyrin repeat domain-containing protein n=1 Tax=Natronomicrosphaera hydrolytica TaxID=3242702 RepID=A0ABV4U4T3_9BACT